MAESSLNTIVVRALKYDRTEHRSWSGSLVLNEPPLLVVGAEFADEVEHELLGTILEGTISVEYYWLNRWYNIFRFGDKEKTPATFYCNVTLPPVFDGATLSYVDLDIDILVKPDLRYEVLDLDDFEANAKLYSYPGETQLHAQRAVRELIEMIESRQFPFDR